MDLIRTPKDNKFKYYFSLGGKCISGLFLRYKKVRRYSGPFDWVITPHFKNVIDYLRNQGKNQLNKNNMYQLYKGTFQYYDMAYDTLYVHDFDDMLPLSFQLGHVKRKYQRRSKRFFKCIQNKTLFIRYCYLTEDINYVESNYEIIIRTIKSFNKDNEIVFIRDRNSEIITKHFAVIQKETKYNNCLAIETSPDITYLFDNPSDSIPKGQKKRELLYAKYIKLISHLYGRKYFHNKRIDK